MICKTCGTDFLQTHGSQKLCPNCRDQYRTRWNEKVSAERALKHINKTCTVCGAIFSGFRTQTCSDECRLSQRRATKKLYKANYTPIVRKPKESQLDEKERLARTQGLHYRDIQIAETLRMYGKVQI